MATTRKRIISVTVEESHHKYLQHFTKMGISASKVVRRAIEEFAKKHGSPKPSVYRGNPQNGD